MKDGKPWLPTDDVIFGPGQEVKSRMAFANGQEVPNRVLLEKDYNPGTAQPGDVILKSLSKDTNPKEIYGNQKLPLDVVPGTMEQYCSLALLEGALKYGRYNWRVKGVRVSTYISAAKRHLDKYIEGQWADPKSKVPHLANALACITIILDAGLMGSLIDDRPPSLPDHDRWIDNQSEIVQHLQEIFKDHHPHQYTISDVASNSEDTCPST